MTELREVIEYLEATLAPGHLEEVRARSVAALSYRPAEPPPLSLAFPVDGRRWAPYPYAEAFDDPAKMMVNELLRSFGSAVNSADVRDDFPIAIRSNHGVGIIASLFGLKCRIVFDSMPWVDHLDSVSEVRRLVDRGLPDVTGGLMARVLATHEFYREKLAEYPVCRRCIRITQPDLQGPFDIAHLIWGPDVYMAMYDEPTLAHRLLALATEAYVGAWRALRPTVDDGAGDGFIYLHGQILPGGVLIKDDSAVNLGAEMYREFVRPRDARILEAAGGGGVHFCGRADHLRDEILSLPGLRCVDFGQPEKNDFKKWQAECRRRRVALVRVLLNLLRTPAADVRREFPTGATLFYESDDRDTALAYFRATRRPV